MEDIVSDEEVLSALLQSPVLDAAVIRQCNLVLHHFIVDKNVNANVWYCGGS